MADSKHAFMVVVPANWTPDMPIGLSQATHDRFVGSLEGGVRVLIYKGDPVNAIVAEGEVIDHLMVRLDDWPHIRPRERPLTGTGQPADYVLPLRILYQRASFDYIDLPTVQEWIDNPDFPNVEWMPINADAYGEFTNWP
jgi:hypothetical protein